MDRFELLADARALQSIRKHEGFYALERLIKRKKDDLFGRWSTDERLTKDYCKGALDILDGLIRDVDELVDYIPDLQEARNEEETLARHFLATVRGTASDGQGTGDLAL